MFGTNALRIVLALWVLWHFAFGMLATFSPGTGAQLSGWNPEGGWTADMVGLSTQYGMTMLLLALVYALMALDPLRYLALLWVAVVEQALGIAYALYLHVSLGNITLTQMAIQAAINLAVIALFVTFWLRLRAPSAADA